MKAMIILYVESDIELQNADTDYEYKIPQGSVYQWLCLTPGLLIVRVWVLSLGPLLDLSSLERTDESLSFSQLGTRHSGGAVAGIIDLFWECEH